MGRPESASNWVGVAENKGRRRIEGAVARSPDTLERKEHSFLAA